MQESYNDLDILPQAMSDSLQLRLRPPRENAAHGSWLAIATESTYF